MARAIKVSRSRRSKDRHAAFRGFGVILPSGGLTIQDGSRASRWRSVPGTSSRRRQPHGRAESGRRPTVRGCRPRLPPPSRRAVAPRRAFTSAASVLHEGSGQVRPHVVSAVSGERTGASPIRARRARLPVNSSWILRSIPPGPAVRRGRRASNFRRARPAGRRSRKEDRWRIRPPHRAHRRRDDITGSDADGQICRLGTLRGSCRGRISNRCSTGSETTLRLVAMCPHETSSPDSPRRAMARSRSNPAARRC